MIYMKILTMMMQLGIHMAALPGRIKHMQIWKANRAVLQPAFNAWVATLVCTEARA